MKNTKLIFMAIIAVLCSCKSDPNGTYIIYSTEVLTSQLQNSLPTEYNLDASKQIAQRLKGKKYLVNYTDKFVTMKLIDGGQEILLNRDNEVYKIKRSDTTYHTGLTLDGKMTDIVLTAHSNQKEPSIKLQLTMYANPTDSVGSYAFIRCELVKTKEK